MAVRDKLESLCKELQHHNKILMDECKCESTEGHCQPSSKSQILAKTYIQLTIRRQRNRKQH